MKEKTFSDPLEPLSEDANRAMLGCCEELAKDASDAMWMMDDIVRRAEENIRLWNDNNKYVRLVRNAYECKYGKPKEIDMEEKKTKKMTKAEAFEWLKGKKVRVCGRETSQKVQSKLFACGVQWMSGGTDFCDYGNYYVINSLGRLGFCDGMSSFWKNLTNEEISADDILSIEIVDEKKNELEFNYDKVVELAKPLMHYLNEVGFPDSIRINQLGIVHEPMSTLIFDNGIGE